MGVEFREDLNGYDRSISKSVYAHMNEGNWCENHSCNFSHFQRRPFDAEEEAAIAETWTNGWFGCFLPVSLAMHFSYLGDIIG